MDVCDSKEVECVIRSSPLQSLQDCLKRILQTETKDSRYQLHVRRVQMH